MSRLTKFLTGVGCGFCAAMLCKASQRSAPAPSTLPEQAIPRAEVINQALAATDASPDAPMPELDETVRSVVQGAGFVWQKMQGLAEEASGNHSQVEPSFEQKLSRLASWPQMLQQALATQAAPKSPPNPLTDV